MYNPLIKRYNFVYASGLIHGHIQLGKYLVISNIRDEKMHSILD